MSYKYVVVDTEGYTAETMLGLSICTPLLESIYIPYGHKEDVNVDQEVRTKVKDTLTRVPYRIYHNAGHDITILPFTRDLPFVCTMIMAHMIDENVMSKSLDYLHKYYTGKEGKNKPPVMEQIIKSMGWEWVPFELMNLYGDNDAVITMELFLELLPKYEEQFGPLWTPSYK